MVFGHCFRNTTMSDIVTTQFEDTSDAALVLASLGGDRNAYGKIIERYQRLLCSIAYSSLGSLSESEDVAQEAFIEGWMKLSSLKDPDKVKAWLSGILRFKISHRVRKSAREPLRSTSPMEVLESQESEDVLVEEQTMKNEEQELLWTALEKVPANYREPLILYYREHQSLEHVASDLEISEDAAKQRLSRGRKMLQERMMSFVEEALVKSSPSKVFTMGVLAALPSLAPTAKAVGMGAAVAQAGSITKTAGLAAILASFSGLISSFFMVRANLDQSRTERERKNVIKSTIIFIGGSLGFVFILMGMMFAAFEFTTYATSLTIASQLLILAFLVWFPITTFRLIKEGQEIRTQERKYNPEAFSDPRDQIGSKAREYKSKWKLFGIPLVHIQFSIQDKGERPAIGWIALGDKAYGILFAFGGFAVGGISVGLVSFGLITCSVIGIGIVGMGTIGIGLLGMGAIGIGYKAFGSLSATGWESAWGPGFAVAKEAAIGGMAYAKEVNTELAAQMASLQQVEQYHVFVLCAISILVIVPVILYAEAIRKRMKRSPK
jgi:RNA polymerase sigma factor (sigma-70 family)